MWGAACAQWGQACEVAEGLGGCEGIREGGHRKDGTDSAGFMV